MDNVERLLKGTVEELDRLLNAKNVLGEPIVQGEATLVPLVSYGFGFGAGGGGQTGGGAEAGQGAGTGAGGGIKPVAIAVIDPDGVRLHPIKTGGASLVESVGEVIGTVVDKATAKKAGAGKTDTGAGDQPEG